MGTKPKRCGAGLGTIIRGTRACRTVTGTSQATVTTISGCGARGMRAMPAKQPRGESRTGLRSRRACPPASGLWSWCAAQAERQTSTYSPPCGSSGYKGAKLGGEDTRKNTGSRQSWCSWLVRQRDQGVPRGPGGPPHQPDSAQMAESSGYPMRKKKERIVSMELDPTNPAPPTPKQKAELAALAEMPDEEIDYSDIPKKPAGFWADAVRGGLHRPVKRQLTVRIDADVLAWLRSQGTGYHSRLDQILRSAMLKDLRRR